MPADITVIGQRIRNGISSNFANVLDITYLMQVVVDDSTWRGSLPGPIRDLFDIRGEITVDGFDPKHENLIKLAIAKLATLPMFKNAFESQRDQSINISFERTDDLGAHGRINVGNGYNIFVELPQINFGGSVPDSVFVQTAIEEIIHTFRNSAWDARLHNSPWEKDLYFQLGLNNLADQFGHMDLNGAYGGSRPIIVGDMDGGSVSGGNTPSLLTGTSFGNTFNLGFAGDVAMGGNGNDFYQISIGGGVDSIQDEGGVDTLLFSEEVDLSSFSVTRSVDNETLSIYIDNEIEVHIEATAGSTTLEYVKLEGHIYSLSAFTSGVNFAPTISSYSSDVYGNVSAGVVGRAVADDVNGDPLHYFLLDIVGDYSGLPWYVSDDGYVTTGFNRLINQADEYTILKMFVTDGASSVSFDYIVHWGEASPNWFRTTPLSGDVEIINFGMIV